MAKIESVRALMALLQGANRIPRVPKKDFLLIRPGKGAEEVDAAPYKPEPRKEKVIPPHGNPDDFIVYRPSEGRPKRLEEALVEYLRDASKRRLPIIQDEAPPMAGIKDGRAAFTNSQLSPTARNVLDKIRKGEVKQLGPNDPLPDYITPKERKDFFGEEAPKSQESKEAARRELLRKKTDEWQTQKYEREQDTNRKLGFPVRGMSGWSQERPGMFSRDPEGTGGAVGSLAMGAGKAYPFAEYLFSPVTMLKRAILGKRTDWDLARNDVKEALYQQPEYPGLEAAGLLGTAFATRGIPPAVDYADMATFGVRNPELMPEPDLENLNTPLMIGANLMERKLLRKELRPQDVSRLAGGYGRLSQALDDAGAPSMSRLPTPTSAVSPVHIALNNARQHAAQGAMRPEKIQRQAEFDEGRLKQIAANPNNRVTLVSKPNVGWAGATEPKTGDIQINVAPVAEEVPSKNVPVVARGLRQTEPSPRMAEIPVWTKRRSTLEHEIGERSTAQGESPFLAELPNDVGHGGPYPRMKEWAFLANRDPDLFAEALYGSNFTPNKTERIISKIFREWGGSYGHPLPTDKKTQHEFAVRLRRAIIEGNLRDNLAFQQATPTQRRNTLKMVRQAAASAPPQYVNIVNALGGNQGPLMMSKPTKASWFKTPDGIVRLKGTNVAVAKDREGLWRVWSGNQNMGGFRSIAEAKAEAEKKKVR